MSTNISRLFNETSSIPNFSQALERALDPYGSLSLRVPFYLTSSLRDREGIKGVSMIVNPNNVSFRTAKRITKTDTQGGSVFTHWTNRLGRNNDILQMEFTGQTGNIHLKRGGYRRGGWVNEVSGRINKGVDWLNQKSAEAISARDSAIGIEQKGITKNLAGASKLANFHNLNSLTREPVVDPRTGAPVYYYITYSSPLFGNTMITFIGHFNEALSFTDAAEPSPFSINYSFSFTAQSSYPSLDYIYSVILTNLSREFMNDIG